MRKYKPEQELREIADLNSVYINIRTMDGGNSHDVTRRATKKQREVLRGVILGALLGLNWGEKCRSTPEMEQAIIDAAEFTGDLLMAPYLKDGEELQGYMSIYIPLKRIVAAWEQA